MKYAGIGSRKTPDDVLELMTEIASQLGELGWTLRSGAADGADTAFQEGAKEGEIYLPWNGYNLSEVGVVLDCLEAWEKVSKHFHPAPQKCTIGTQRLHGRNAHIILGEHLDDPVDMVICWTPQAKVVGGTGLAIDIANHFEIPVFNLADPDQIDKLVAYVDSKT